MDLYLQELVLPEARSLKFASSRAPQVHASFVDDCSPDGTSRNFLGPIRCRERAATVEPHPTRLFSQSGLNGP